MKNQQRNKNGNKNKIATTNFPNEFCARIAFEELCHTATKSGVKKTCRCRTQKKKNKGAKASSQRTQHQQGETVTKRTSGNFLSLFFIFRWRRWIWIDHLVFVNLFWLHHSPGPHTHIRLCRWIYFGYSLICGVCIFIWLCVRVCVFVVVYACIIITLICELNDTEKWFNGRHTHTKSGAQKLNKIKIVKLRSEKRKKDWLPKRREQKLNLNQQPPTHITIIIAAANDDDNVDKYCMITLCAQGRERVSVCFFVIVLCVRAQINCCVCSSWCFIVYCCCWLNGVVATATTTTTQIFIPWKRECVSISIFDGKITKITNPIYSHSKKNRKNCSNGMHLHV